MVQAQAAAYSDLLRNALEIPESKIILLGIAIGYPDWEHPINQFRTEREPLDSIATRHGFLLYLALSAESRCRKRLGTRALGHLDCVLAENVL